MDRRLLGLLIVAVAGLTACGRYASAPPAAAGYRLFLEEGYNGAEQVTVLDSGTGTIERQLPLGTPAPDWSRYYVVTHLTGSERLSALDPASGRTLGQISIAAGFRLPTLGFIGPSAGLSPNGQWLVLTRQAGSVSRFLVGSSSLSRAFTTVQLQGDFSFDAISNDGQSLYLIQKMGDPNHYQVRLVEVASKALLVEQPVADKREPSEPMNGIRGDSLADPTGKYVFTVYARNNGPFIHALPLGQPVAWCLDLPAKNASNIEEQFQWSLASRQDGTMVYAVNSSSGFITEIAPGMLPAIRRSAHVAMNASSGLLGGLVTNAEAKGARIGGAALSPDGRTLFAVADAGIAMIDVATLKTRSRILDGENVESIRLSADGHWLYAAGGGSGKLWQIDPTTGAVPGQVKGGSSPWALLWAEPK